MSTNLVNPSEKTSWHHLNEKRCCENKKILIIALAIILIVAGAVATGTLHSQLGHSSLTFASAGIVLGTILIGIACKMPTSPASGQARLPSQALAGTLAEAREKLCQNDANGTALVHFSFIEADEGRAQAKRQVAAFLQDPLSTSMDFREKLAMAVLLGMACGDTIGAPYEFRPFKCQGYSEEVANRFSLQAGQWTDDTSMGLCLADMLIENRNLDETQLMWAFRDWWEHGYNNAFTQGEVRHSIGLGGNIHASFNTFKGKRKQTGTFTTDAGNQFTSGNGSLMRLGAVAIAAKSEAEAMDLAWRQSKVTHQGDEAAGCCQLMAFLIFHALHEKKQNPQERKQILFEKLKDFSCTVPSVNGLAKSLTAVESPFTKKQENWNWKEEIFCFHPGRLAEQPGYIGSYSMDAMAMALHCVYTTHSFKEAVLKAATRGGDADTVGAITGQIAGALYGFESIPDEWKNAVQQWDRGGEIATRAYLLCH
jgi:ADP-ribosyl-[dinitrogen reductase] hydrolase